MHVERGIMGKYTVDMKVGKDESKEGRRTLLRSSCLIMVYKNLDISGLLGMVGLTTGGYPWESRRCARITTGPLGAVDGQS
jgi:hypothetical protein